VITYQVRRRTFRLGERKPPILPADVVIRIRFAPPQPFGGDGPGRAVSHEGKAHIVFNSNTGQHVITSEPPLDPLEVIARAGNQEFRFSGPELCVTGRFESLHELDQFIQSLVLGLPWLLNVEFADPPYVERVNGEIAGIPFVWELEQWAAHFGITTTALQEKKVAYSLLRFSVAAAPGRRRLLAALHYFHKACRLNREAKTAGEFLAEELLNLSKCLEVLFPGDEGQQTADAARSGLTALRYSGEEIERDFVPAILLRNHIDVGHVYLGVFSVEQLTTLHEFADRSEGVFRTLFERIFSEIDAGRWDVPAYDLHDPPARSSRIIDRLAQAAPSR
jgi:hypothetical protein